MSHAEFLNLGTVEGRVEKKEDKRTLEISDFFWRKMRGLVRVQNIENPRYIDIVFNSFKRSIQETLHRIKVANEGQNDDWVVGGV